jgi:predicted Zn-dependent peptidase
MIENLMSQMCIGMGMGMVIVPSDFKSIEKLEEIEEIIGTAKQRLIQEEESKIQRKQELRHELSYLKDRIEELAEEYESL